MAGFIVQTHVSGQLALQSPHEKEAPRRSKTPPAKRAPLGRTAWLDAARAALVEEGTAGVEVKKLARRLRSSRGGFLLGFFTSRQHLLDELGQYWAETSMAPFEKVLRMPGTTAWTNSKR